MNETVSHSETDEPFPGDALFAATRESLAAALRRSMQVACQDDEGRVSKISQHDLADRAGLARSSVAKYLAGGHGDGERSNPDLRSLCRMAAALNVPPALLLMRTSDWTRLVQAAHTLSLAMKDAGIQAVADGLGLVKENPAERAAMALQVAQRMSMTTSRPIKIDDHGESNVRARRELQSIQDRQRMGVVTTCALPPLGRLDQYQQAALLCLCAVIGATTHQEGNL